MAHAIRRYSGRPVLEFDLYKGPAFDLTRRATQKMICSWISSRTVRGIWSGFPCSTWSRARWPPLRTSEQLRGTPAALQDSRTSQLLEQGNLTQRFACRISKLCAKTRVPLILENPSSSMAWSMANMQRVLQDQHTCSIVLDYCQYGTQWRKRTRLAGICVTNLERLEKRCCGKNGICSRTGAEHLRLRGTAKDSSQLLTRLAEAYPRKLCPLAARVLVDSAEQAVLNRIFAIGTA